MTKAYTVREVIDYLSHWQNQEQKVAWLIFTKYDIEGDLEYYEFPSLEEAWNESVDEIQDALNSSWVTEHIAETIELPDGRSFPRTYIVTLEELNQLNQLLETINNTYPQEEN